MSEAGAGAVRLPWPLRWTITALGTLGLAFGVLPQVYEQLGWSQDDGFVGAVLAALVLGCTLALAEALRERIDGAKMIALAVGGVVFGVVIGPALVHVALTAAARVDPVPWTHGDLLDVAKLADDEPVRGTGCGAHPGTRITPNRIPDGIWFGAIRTMDDAELGFDLICAYASEADARLNPAYAGLADHGQVVRYPAAHPTWLALNANERVRSVPTGSNFRYHEGRWSADGQCDNGRASAAVALDAEVWLVIADGRAVLAERICDVAHAPS